MTSEQHVTTAESIKVDELIDELARRIRANNIPFDDKLPHLLLGAIRRNESLGALFRQQTNTDMYTHPAFQALHGANRW